MLDLIINKFHFLPDTPGIYLFYGQNSELIYVGKASSLRNRVRSYWNGQLSADGVEHCTSPSAPAPKRRGRLLSRPIEALIREVVDLKWKQTDSALEAAILEANYIKKFLPKYNVIGKDNKSWNYVGITNEEYPRVVTIREHELNQLGFNRKSEIGNQKLGNYLCIFGPYPGVNTKATMKILRRLFGFSTCQRNVRTYEKQRTNIRTTNNYIRYIRKSGLSGNLDINKRPCLYYQMGECLGVCIGVISPAAYKKRVINPLVMFLRGKKKPLIRNLESRMRILAKTQEFEEAGRVRDQIKKLQHIHDIAMLNKSFFEDNQFQISDFRFQITRIEGYDISNLGSTGVVGSMVVFIDGEPDKSQYRKFKIRTFAAQSDVAALAEVLTRRLLHAGVRSSENTEPQAGLKEVKSHKSKVISRDYWPFPDLILVDGGKPQVNRAQQILQEHNLDIPVVGIAKGPERKRNDIIIDKGKLKIENLKILSHWAYAHTRLLIAVRDEAHRFAVAYQRKLRRIR